MSFSLTVSRFVPNTVWFQNISPILVNTESLYSSFSSVTKTVLRVRLVLLFVIKGMYANSWLDIKMAFSLKLLQYVFTYNNFLSIINVNKCLSPFKIS